MSANKDARVPPFAVGLFFGIDLLHSGQVPVPVVFPVIHVGQMLAARFSFSNLHEIFEEFASRLQGQQM